MATLPSSLSLTSILDGTLAIAADVRNNYAAIQTAVNGLITALTGGTAGDVLGGNGTTLTYAKPPGYELAYVEFTANVTANNVAEASATQVVSAGAITFDGTAVIIEFGCAGLATGGVATGGINLWDVATDQGRLFDGRVVNMAASDYPVLLRRKLTPSAGAHTYNIRIWNTTASNFLATAGAGGAGGAAMPGYIRITKA